MVGRTAGSGNAQAARFGGVRGTWRRRLGGNPTAGGSAWLNPGDGRCTAPAGVLRIARSRDDGAAAQRAGEGLSGGAAAVVQGRAGSAMEGGPRLAGVAHRSEPGHEPTDLPPAAREGRGTARQCPPRHHRRAVRARQSAGVRGDRRAQRRTGGGAADGLQRATRGGRGDARQLSRLRHRLGGDRTRQGQLPHGRVRSQAGGAARALRQLLLHRRRPGPDRPGADPGRQAYAGPGGDPGRLGCGRAGVRQQCRGRHHERPHDHQRQLGRRAGPPTGRGAARHQAQHRPRAGLLPGRAGRPAFPAARAVGAAGGGAAGHGRQARLRHRREHRHGDRGRQAHRPGRDRADPRRREPADRQAGGRGSGRAQAQLPRSRRQPGPGLAQGAARAGQAAGARTRALLPRTDPGRQGGVRRLHHPRDPGPAGRGRPHPLPQRDHLGLRPCQRQRGGGRADPRAACQGADRAWRSRGAGDRPGLRPAPAGAPRQQCRVLPQPGAGRDGRVGHGGRGRPARAPGQPLAGRCVDPGRAARPGDARRWA